MKNEYLIILLLTIAAGWLIWLKKTQCCNKNSEEDYTSGFSVTSGLSFYNKSRRCSDVDMYGSRSPYCESVGTVMF